MTLCVKTKGHCVCQPDEGAFCPDYKPDAYVQCLMDTITALLRPSGPSVPLEPTKAMLEAAGEAYFSGRPRPILQVCQAVLDIINGTPATSGGNK